MRFAAAAVAFLLVAAARPASTQGPAAGGIGILRDSAPNAAGWHNTVVLLEHFCNAGVACPDEATARDEGVHRLEFPLLDEPVAANIQTLSIDRTAPLVRLSLAAHSSTSATAIDVVADVADALSGLDRAACNGVEARIAADGRVRCRIMLLPGVNDIVVEASDLAATAARPAHG